MEQREILQVDICIICSGNNNNAPISPTGLSSQSPVAEISSEKENLSSSCQDKTVTATTASLADSPCNSKDCNKKRISQFLNQVVNLKKKDEFKDHLTAIPSLFICDKCSEIIASTVDKKACADELEEKVKALKGQLLETTQKLEGQLKAYYFEMKKITEVIKNSDVFKLKTTLEGKMNSQDSKLREKGLKNKRDQQQTDLFMKVSKKDNDPSSASGADNEGTSKMEKSEIQMGKVEMETEKVTTDANVEGNDEKLENTNINEKNYFSFVDKLRESILNLVQELDEKYCDDEDGGVTRRRKSRRLKKKARKRYFDDTLPIAENSGDMILPLLHCTVKLEGQGGDLDQSEEQGGDGHAKRKRDSCAISIPEFNMEQLIKEEPVEEQQGQETNEDGFNEQQDSSVLPKEDDGFEPEVIDEIVKATVARPNRKRKSNRIEGERGDDTLSDLGEEDVDDEFMDTSDDDFFLDEGEDEIASVSESSTSSEEMMDSSEEEDWDDGEEYGRRKSNKAKKEKVEKAKRESKTNPNSKKSRKEAYSKKMDSINFSRMSKLKRKLIQRVLHKKYRRPTRKPKTPGKEEVDDPRLEHFIEYDSLFDILSLDGITINIHDEKNGEGEDILCLECSFCGWRARPAHNSRHPVDSFMYNHIAGQHLNLFQCVQCGSNLGGYKQYSDHVLGHRMGFACDVCGRPLGGSQALARHKWSHLNEEEAAELVAKGLKDPREKKESTKIYPCPTCAKIFPQRCQLKKHEKVHSEDRERITCEICGKLFLPSGFISHKRYYCFPEGVEQPRISCPLCPKVFKNKQFMQVHMDRAHNTERNHKCPQCGKGFKTKKDLMTHEETHTTERAFSCKKGCGRTYKTRKNCNAHEKRCDGRGGVLIQRFLDAGDDRPFSCRKGCGRAYKTRRTLRGHEKTCNGSPFVADLAVGGGVGGGGGGIPATNTEVTTMTVLGAALQASMEAVMGGGVIQTTAGGVHTTIADSVPEAVATETVVTKSEFN